MEKKSIKIPKTTTSQRKRNLEQIERKRKEKKDKQPMEKPAAEKPPSKQKSAAIPLEQQMVMLEPSNVGVVQAEEGHSLGASPERKKRRVAEKKHIYVELSDDVSLRLNNDDALRFARRSSSAIDRDEIRTTPVPQLPGETIRHLLIAFQNCGEWARAMDGLQARVYKAEGEAREAEEKAKKAAEQLLETTANLDAERTKLGVAEEKRSRLKEKLGKLGGELDKKEEENRRLTIELQQAQEEIAGLNVHCVKLEKLLLANAEILRQQGYHDAKKKNADPEQTLSAPSDKTQEAIGYSAMSSTIRKKPEDLTDDATS